MRVLVVEDEELLADTIAAGLREEAIAVDVAYDGASALDRAAYVEYDVVILDRDLLEVHGDEVCRRLVARRSGGRVLMLTAAGDVDQRVDGLSLGADDYLAKPFVFAELVARVRAPARRSAPPLPPVLERSGVRLDPRRRTVSRDGRPVTLTRKEFTVLEELLRADGGVVSAERLLDKAWDENVDPFSNIVRVAMATLRRKLGAPPVIGGDPGARPEAARQHRPARTAHRGPAAAGPLRTATDHPYARISARDGDHRAGTADRAGGMVRVRTGTEGDTAVLRVDNTGPPSLRTRWTASSSRSAGCARTGSARPRGRGWACPSSGRSWPRMTAGSRRRRGAAVGWS
jgi:DNA-binding response OmpR family regulator